MACVDQKTRVYYVRDSEQAAWVMKQYLSPEEAQVLFDHCLNKIPWIRHVLYSGSCRERKQNRMSCSMGAAYSYSGSIHPQSPWDPLVFNLMQRVNQEFGTSFNSCLLNYYKNGNESISAHSDETKHLSGNHMVLGISLGAQRIMTLRHKNNHRQIRVPLNPGSLFCMEGAWFQPLWTHAIDKDPDLTDPRISLTFRKFHDSQEN